MEFCFTPEQTYIAETAQAVLARHMPATRLHKILASGDSMDTDLWSVIARDMGWLATAIPEHLGGAGLTAVDLAILMQETGAVLAPVPFFATAALAIPAILAAGTPHQQASLMPELLAGAPATLGFTGAQGLPGCEGVTALLDQNAPTYCLTGTAGFVPHAAAAKYLVIACRAPGSRGAAGISLVCLPASTPGLGFEHHISLDLTRPYSTIHFENVEVPPGAILGAKDSAGPAFKQTLAFAVTMLAAEQLGGAERTLSLSLDHAKTRVQFGRPIGSFQAIKHKLADMKLLVESARSATYYAACTAAESPHDLPEAASIAQAYCADAFASCAAETIQIHGGMGFTWDHPAHLYFKRARAAATMLGDASYHREKIARLMGLHEAAA